VQTSGESANKISLANQRYLINNFKNATELGAEVIQKKADNIAAMIIETVKEKQITTVCIGKPHVSLFKIILKTGVFNQLLKTLSEEEVDLVILS
jgi:two-component system sensor histidine kinase KdpD